MPSSAAAAAEKLAWELGSWKSIEIRVREDGVNRSPARLPSSPRTFQTFFHYVETAAGQRLFEGRMSNDNDSKTTVSSEYTDGIRYAQLIRTDLPDKPGVDQVAIVRSFGYESDGVTQRPDALKYLYVGLKPLPEVLTRATELGPGRRLDRDCDRFLFTHVNGLKDRINHVYWLDRETGLTLRYEYYDNERKHAEGRPYFVWNALSVDAVNGRHIAMKSELLQFDLESPDTQRVLYQYSKTVEEVAFDRDYPKTMFWPRVTGETMVLDNIKNTIVSPTRGKTPDVAHPIRAIDPEGWGTSWPVAGMMLGIAALVTGVVLRWRKR